MVHVKGEVNNNEAIASPSCMIAILHGHGILVNGINAIVQAYHGHGNCNGTAMGF